MIGVNHLKLMNEDSPTRFREHYRRFKRGALFPLLTLLVLSAASSAFAQTSGSSTLRGVVRDPDGAVVPAATVTLTLSRTGETRNATTNDDGSYVFPSISPGDYLLRVEKAGFAPSEVSELRVSPSETRSQDVTVQIGGANETVTVVASAGEIKTETGERSNTITAEQINNLSIVGRSSLELLRVLPGVVAPNDPSAFQSTGFNAGANASNQYNVNGLRGETNNVSIDGSRTVDIGSNNGTIITANNDMVQEVEVKSSNYAAEYGSAGVQISAVTKGGGNEFHGTLYDYIRPAQLQANDRSNTIAGTPRPQSKFQYPGGNFGGPVCLPRFGEGGPVGKCFKDKLFFFVGLEFQRQSIDPGTRRGVVPTLRQRRGDFSEFLPGGALANTLNQGASQLNIPGGYIGATQPDPANPDQTIRVPAANNNLAPYADPLGSVLLNLYPLPNYTDPQGRYNYASAVLTPLNRVDAKMRFDYKLSDRTNIYLRLARESETQDFAYGLWWGPSNYELPSHVIGTNLGRSAALNVTTVISPTMTNEVVFSASRLLLDNDYADPSKVSRAALGLSNYNLPFNSASPYVPLAIVSQGWDDLEASPSNQPGLLYNPPGLPLFAHNDSYSVTNNLSKIWGAHTLKFGGLIEQANKQQNTSQNSEGQIILSNWGNGGTGNQFGDLFTGQVTQFNKSTAPVNGSFRFYNFEFYAQDSWKVRPNFTLEYGLRAAYYPTNREINGLGAVFDPAAYDPTQGAYINNDPQRPNGLLLASRGQIPQGVVENPPIQFAPRLNFAWDISGKGDTVIRGGGGLFYSRVQGNYQYGVLGLPPTTFSVFYDSGSDAAAIRDRAGRDLPLLAGAALVDPFQKVGAYDINTQSLISNEIPRIASMSLSVAKRLPFQNVLEVAYVGTLGRHLPSTTPTNVIAPTFSGTLGNANLADPLQRAAVFQANPGSITNRLRRFPTLGNINTGEFTGTSNYHSLQATLSRQLGRNLQYFLTYTFSKALGTANTNETGTQADPFDVRGRSYGLLPYDRTHILNLSYNYSLPDVARGRLDNAFARGVLNGWQFSGITTYASGPPLRIQVGGDFSQGYVRAAYLGTNSTGNGTSSLANLPPLILSNPDTGRTGLGAQLIDPSAFGIPAFGTTGPFQSPFYIRAPSRTNFDFTLFKNFNFTETRYLQFRAGFFNAFNFAFADPGRSDIDVTLQTTCNAFLPGGIPNGEGVTASDNTVCDPTRGFRINPGTFGTITNKHGHRIIELALKFYF